RARFQTSIAQRSLASAMDWPSLAKHNVPPSGVSGDFGKVATSFRVSRFQTVSRWGTAKQRRVPSGEVAATTGLGSGWESQMPSQCEGGTSAPASQGTVAICRSPGISQTTMAPWAVAQATRSPLGENVTARELERTWKAGSL